MPDPIPNAASNAAPNPTSSASSASSTSSTTKFCDGLAKHRRGNPRWASPSAYSLNVPAQPSAWDRLLYRLSLQNDAAAVDQILVKGPLAAQIVQWVRHNRSKFIPELVLEALGEKEAVEGQHWWGSGCWKR